jgi:hypothetical protein
VTLKSIDSIKFNFTRVSAVKGIRALMSNTFGLVQMILE